MWKTKSIHGQRTGASAIEYVFIVALIAVVILATASALGTATSSSIEASSEQIAEAINAP